MWCGGVSTGTRRVDVQIRSRVAWRRVAVCQRGVVERDDDNRMNTILTGGPMNAWSHLSASCLLLVFSSAAFAADDAGSWFGSLVGPDPKLEGAIGPVIRAGPEYQGASRQKYSLLPGVFIRYGRLSLSNTSDFATRRRDDVFRGLGLDLVSDERVRMNVSLRLDKGRRSSVSSALNGVDDVRRTIRVRTSAVRQLGDGWKVGAGWSADLLGRGGGNVLELGLSHDQRLGANRVLTVATGFGMADRRYMQSYYGVTEAQSVISGYPVYRPGAGLRDVALAANLRVELDPRWTAFGNVSVSKLLGPTLDSPLTGKPRQWAISSGLAWRF